jgi:hypothetical protein
VGLAPAANVVVADEEVIPSIEEGTVLSVYVKHEVPADELPVTDPDDPRRQYPVEVSEDGQMYRLRVLDTLWSTVEFSSKRQVWCVEDSANRCLTHVSAIHGDAASAAAAVRLAKQMIRDGRIPTPEHVRARMANESVDL